MDGRVLQSRKFGVTSLILMSLTVMLVIENPQIAAPQTPADQLRQSDSTRSEEHTSELQSQ